MKNYQLALFLLLLSACTEQKMDPLFREVPTSHSRLEFVNEIQETDSLNILTDEFMYNGGGIGVGDFNQDGLQDLYFTGNMVPNSLYLNQGNFTFIEVSSKAGVAAQDTWSSGVSVVDINNDGLSDLYVSATFKQDRSSRKNKLFINQGTNDEGIPIFTEEAEAFGLADTSYNTHSYFFDYDKDGDLDVFLLNDKLFSPRSTTDLNLLMEGGEATIDKLYRNNGDNFFTDVSQEAGITEPGFGLGAAIFDANRDGWLDIYVSNDFISNDLLYINQRDGTFENQIEKYFKHHSFSSMGIDVSDINQDGAEDLMTLDMLPEDRSRVKRTYAFQKFQFYDLMERTGYLMQYNRNSLHLGNPSGRYNEVGELLGVDATEWSWSVLFADFDNDGYRDLAISNGYPRDITDMDFTDYNTGLNHIIGSQADLLAQIPVVKVPNYFFRNESGKGFTDKSDAWGLKTPSFSNGAVVADLDNDGDLDYVVNNINDPVHLYENKQNAIAPLSHSLRISLIGEKNNRDAIGAEVRIHYAGKSDIAKNIPQRGYLSSIEHDIHFGIGNTKKIDSLIIRWPEGEYSLLKNIEISGNKILLFEKKRMNTFLRNPLSSKAKIFTTSKLEGLDIAHNEVNFFDYNFQGLLPRLHSREGPGIAVGDINGDQIEDLVVGNGSRATTTLFYSQADGSYLQDSLTDVKLSEDVGLLLFDSDGDGDLDLYIGSGSTEFRKGSRYFHDKFYLNDGKGNLRLAMERIPQISISTSSVSAADYDHDGDLDIFIAGRIDPQNYPHAPSSYLLQNDGGKFSIAEAPVLDQVGMISQGLWTDFDQDGWEDLLLVGEWMPITLLQNDKGNLVPYSQIEHSSGWWNSISSVDLDADGDMDYVLGNQGLNNKLKASPEHPLWIYAHDFDQNGSVDPVITQYDGGKYFPVHLKMDLTRQLNLLKKKYAKYESYAAASIDEILDPDTLAIAQKYKAEHFASSILWNDGTKFRLEPLPLEAQYAPIYASLPMDIDGDADIDMLLVGNRYSTEVFEGRHDALNGLLLLNDGEGTLKAANNQGFLVDADARSLVNLVDKDQNMHLIAGVNDGSSKKFQFTKQNEQTLVHVLADEVKALIFLKNGEKILKEFYPGSGFLSQSSPHFFVPQQHIQRIEFYKSDGSMRSLNF